MARATWLLLLTSLTAALLCHAQLCGDWSRWTRVFTLDVAAHGYTHTFPGLSFLDCVRECTELAHCQMFGHNSGSATCWLYDHVVDTNSNGTAVPDTRYWSWCPLDYTLTSGVCFKKVMIWKSWTEARDYCRQERGDLYVADTTERIELVYDISGWIGGTLEQGVWRWLNGKPVLGGWLYGSPLNRTDYDCMRCHNWKLYNHICSAPLPFICEMYL